nr:MAG TPA: hypothetical protein [Microviridae sp.]
MSVRGSVRASPPPHPQRAYLSASALRMRTPTNPLG